MARIETYPFDLAPTVNDYVIGTDGDNSNATSIGLIKWTDIIGITTSQVMSSKFIMIEVQNPEEYIAKAKNPISKRAMKANMKMYGSPITIISKSLKYNFPKLESTLKELIKEKMDAL